MNEALRTSPADCPSTIFDRSQLEREVIRGCVDSSILMMRYKLLKTRAGNLYLHRLMRSDEDRELHDHPWPFASLILRGGYWEEMPVPSDRVAILSGTYDADKRGMPVTERRFHPPLSLLFRPARWAHRLDIPPGTEVWTLVWVSSKRRPWGFFTAEGWLHWKRYGGAKRCVDGDL